MGSDPIRRPGFHPQYPGSSPEDSPAYQNLREFLEAIEACNAALDAKEQEAVNVEIIASEAVERADTILQAIAEALTEDWNTLVQAVQATDQALDEATAAANAAVEAELPEAVRRLEEVPSLLDAAVDPVRAESVSRFDSLKDDAFALMAGHVQQAGTSIEAADDGSSSLQPFLELPAELHTQAETHASDQQQEVAEIDQRTTAVAAASDATHAAAEEGARTWGETCCTALEGNCETQAVAAETAYEVWQVTAEPQATQIAEAIESAGTRLTGALDTEDGNVDRETAEAQGSLDQLHEQMKKAHEELDEGQSIFMTLAEVALPELAIARRVVDKMKDLADAVGP
jgi:hypothetical protein